ncbi:MAG: folylpolyglutamate synthase/dihydrofolate synthase family protein [Ferruginibacter sp.]
MNYQQTIDYLYSQLPMFSRIGAAAIKKDLHNTIELCKVLDDPQKKFKSVHIAGTNGKGSTSHMLAAILQQAGYKTGLYTSPHLKDFRERIKINGEMVSKEFVVDFTARMMEITAQVEPSFFELTVAMAFEYFAQEEVDVAIIETGLGGRLDSTNIITPVLSVITNIGYDHMNILGDTLDKIAFEKAGIIKPGVPAVIGEYTEDTKEIFIQKATETGSVLHLADHHYAVSGINLTLRALACSITNKNKHRASNYLLDLTGLYQLKNLCTVLTAKDILVAQGFKIDDDVTYHALLNVKKLTGLHGRWEVIADNPVIVLDVGHNEDGIREINEHLAATAGQYKALHIITGMVKDKDIDKVLSILPRKAIYYFTNAHIPRALAAAELKEKATQYNLHGTTYENVNNAITAAKKHADKEDLILVCGSVFLVGEVDTALFI